MQNSNLSSLKRVASIDLLRGIVMVLMALDHVRDYFNADNFLFEPNDMAKTNVAIFFTRWITHFSAPVFMFLAGTSAFLVGERKTKKQLSFFLLTRGLWLIVLELTLINLAWSFNPHFPMLRLQVIWALGLCMVFLSVIIYLPKQIILITGLAILFFHNMLDNIHATGNTFADFLWAELHERKRFIFGRLTVATGYPFLSWLGIMCLGYCFGQLYAKGTEVAKRKKYLLAIGIAATLLFVVMRSINIYGDKEPWQVQHSFSMTVCSFLNPTKYPPSLLYTLMTLGPAIIFLALAEKPLGWFGKQILHIGRVPLFFYILHLYLIHLLATIALVLSGREWTEFILPLNANSKDAPWLAGYGFSLWATYLWWVLIVLMLYPLCKWYDQYKQTHKEKWWLSYL